VVGLVGWLAGLHARPIRPSNHMYVVGWSDRGGAARRCCCALLIFDVALQVGAFVLVVGRISNQDGVAEVLRRSTSTDV